MDEATKRRWDVVLGVIAPLLTIAAIGVGVWQYLDGQARQADRDRSARAQESQLAFEREIWLGQLATYREVATQVGKIAAAEQADVADLDKAAQSFLQLYWGSMILVEDAVVEQAMIDFALKVRDLRSGWRPLNDVKRSAQKLGKTLQDSVQTQYRDLLKQP